MSVTHHFVAFPIVFVGMISIKVGTASSPWVTTLEVVPTETEVFPSFSSFRPKLFWKMLLGLTFVNPSPCHAELPYT